MTSPSSRPVLEDAIDVQLVALFRDDSQATPRDPEFVSRLMQQITARQQSRVRVLRSTLLLGLVFAFGSILAWGADWVALGSLLGQKLTYLPLADELLTPRGEGWWLHDFRASLLAPLAAALLWLTLVEQRST